MKKNINNPDELETIKNALKEYTLVFDRHIHLIPTYSRVRYINKKTGEFGYGGQVLKIENESIMLKIYNTFKPIIWNIKYKDYAIYIEDLEKKIIKRKQKVNLYKLYDAGLLKLIE